MSADKATRRSERDKRISGDDDLMITINENKKNTILMQNKYYHTEYVGCRHISIHRLFIPDDYA